MSMARNGPASIDCVALVHTRWSVGSFQFKKSHILWEYSLGQGGISLRWRFDDPVCQALTNGEKMRARCNLFVPILAMGLCSFVLAGCGWSPGETTQEESKEEKAT